VQQDDQVNFETGSPRRGYQWGLELWSPTGSPLIDMAKWPSMLQVASCCCCCCWLQLVAIHQRSRTRMRMRTRPRDMFHVASVYVAMRRIPYKIINECHSQMFRASLRLSTCSWPHPRLVPFLLTTMMMRPPPPPPSPSPSGGPGSSSLHSRIVLPALRAYLASILSETDGCLKALQVS